MDPGYCPGPLAGSTGREQGLNYHVQIRMRSHRDYSTVVFARLVQQREGMFNSSQMYPGSLIISKIPFITRDAGQSGDDMFVIETILIRSEIFPKTLYSFVHEMLRNGRWHGGMVGG